MLISIRIYYHEFIFYAGAATVAIGSAAAAYDVSVFAGNTHVAFESGGSVYYTKKAHGSTSWSAPVEVATGTAPSIAGYGGLPLISWIASNAVNVSHWDGSSWSAVSLGSGAKSPVRAMVRTDGAGTVHLLAEGGSYGSIDHATYSGTTWSGFSNLADGWYDSGYGTYFHQASLAANPFSGGGYAFAFEQSNWGGRPRWSDKSFKTSGFSPNADHGYGWGSGAAVVFDALSIFEDGTAGLGYTIDGAGYVRTFSSGAWSGEVSLGTANNVTVRRTSGATVALFDRGPYGTLQYFDGSSTGQLLLDGTPVAGTMPRFGFADEGEIFFIDSSSGSLMAYTLVPEPSSSWLFAVGALLLAARRRKNPSC